MAAAETPGIRWAKKRATFIGKQEELPHHECLAVVAEALGFRNWFELVASTEEDRQARIAAFNSDSE